MKVLNILALFVTFTHSSYGATLETIANELDGCLQSAATCHDENGYVKGIVTQSLCGTRTWMKTFATSEDFANAVSLKASQLEDKNGLYLIRLNVDASSSVQASISSALGVPVADYLRCASGEYFQIYADKATVDAAAALNEISNVVAVPDILKISPALQYFDTANYEDEDEFAISMRISVGAATDALSAQAIGEKVIEILQGSRRRGLQNQNRNLRVLSESSDYATVQGLLSTDLTVENIKLLAVVNEISWFDKKAVATEHNGDGAVLIHSLRELESEETEDGDLIEYSPFWSAGLHGEGQIVGVGDGGLDFNSCYFEDENVPIEPVVGENNLYPNHRKIVQYFAHADDEDGSGHGTHTSGSVAGNMGSPDRYNGGAPEAKIAFFDVGETGKKLLKIPESLYENYFSHAYDIGARIFSNSWGTRENIYDAWSRDTDRFSFENQDFVALFSQGNQRKG